MRLCSVLTPRRALPPKCLRSPLTPTFCLMLSEDLDELMRRYVFHSVYVFVDQRKVLLHF